MACTHSFVVGFAVGCAVFAGAPAGASAAADLGITSLSTSPKPMTTPDATVTITAANSGDAPATSVVIRFAAARDPSTMLIELPKSITCPPGFTIEESTARYPSACVQGVMGPGATATMVVRIQIPSDESSEPVKSITHAVEIGAVGFADPTPGDTTATETVPVAFDTTGGGAPGAGKDPGGGAEPGGGVTPGGTTPRAPQLTALSLSPSSFRAAASGPSAVAARAGVGTLVTTRLSAAATETFSVERAATGRRVRGRCALPTRANRRAPRCTRWSVLAGRFTARGAAGTNRLRFTGRLAGRRLAPGSYRLVVTARNAAGRTPAPRRAGFRIVR